MNEFRPQHHQSVSLCDALDRVLDTGVVALGELKLSVADVDLLYIGLQLVVTSIETGRALDPTIDDWPQPRGGARHRLSAEAAAATGAGHPKTEPYDSSLLSSTLGGEAATAVKHSTRRHESLVAGPSGHAPDKNAGGLGKLVLTLVKVLHKLLKLQALRRMEAGSLSVAEMEGLGVTLMRQAQEIERMARELGLQPEDLNLDLGPLGKLL